MREAKKNPRLFENYDRNLTARFEKRLRDLHLEPDFTPNALSVLRKRYFRKDENGAAQEDVKGLLARVAANIAYPDFYYTNDEEQAYKSAELFYRAMTSKEFIPNSPTMMNAGREMQQLSACFVLPIEDHMKSIFKGVFDTAMIHKSGGGTGFSFGKLRRKNDYVSSTYGKASGPVSFIGAYDAATHSVNQGGFRRGANMGMMQVTHPDILEFIHAKENERENRFAAFNFSVIVTDEFMKAVKNGEYYILINPRDGEFHELTIEDIKRDKLSVKEGLISQEERVLIVENGEVIYQNPVSRDTKGKVTQVEKKKVGKVDQHGRITLEARVVFDEIAALAWKNGEPGIAFIDRINESNSTHPQYFRDFLLRQKDEEAVKITELLKKQHPNLSLETLTTDYLAVVDKNGTRVNLPVGIGIIEATNPCGEQPLLPYEACNLGSINLGLMVSGKKVAYKILEKVVEVAVRYLDNVISMSDFPLDSITETVQSNRKIGLGVMGWADMLVKLDIPYDSDEARKLAEEVMSFIQKTGVKKSEELAEERGEFPNFKCSYHANGKPRRNATITTIAPTGSIGIIAGSSAGIEPLLGLLYTHKDADGQKRQFINKELIAKLNEKGIDPDKVLKELEKGRSLQKMDFISDGLKKVFATADEISVEGHVRMQAAFQKYTDNAVSKTINLPNSATVEDVKKAYFLAYELGCKGITVYRDGSREEQVLTKPGSLEKAVVHAVSPRKRPEKLTGETVRKRTGCGNLFVTLNYNGNGEQKSLFEIFTTLGKGGGCAASQNEAIGRLVSFLLRSSADPKEIASQLIGIRCNRPYGMGPNAIYSCADAIGRAIAESYGVRPENEIEDSENFEDLVSPKENNAKKDKFNKSRGIKEAIEDIIKKDPSIAGGACPECKSPMIHTEGCIGGKCSNESCGYTSCV